MQLPDSLSAYAGGSFLHFANSQLEEENLWNNISLSSLERNASSQKENRLDTDPISDFSRDIADVAAVEVITTVAVHMLSAAAVKCGLSEEPSDEIDLDEARKLIVALAGLITAAAPELGDHHARSLRDGLRSVQLAFREASPFPDPPGQGPGEKYTGPVN